MSKLEELIRELCPDGVEYKTLNNISSNLDSKRKPVTKGRREAGIYPYYGASGIVDYVSDYIFDGDYLLVSEDGANLVARVMPIAFSASGKIWVNNHAHVLWFETYAERKFTEYYLNMISLSQYVSTAAQPKLTQDNLNKIPVPIPPLPIQQEIVRILDTFTALEAELEAELEKRKAQYEYYRDILIQSSNSFPQMQLSSVLDMKAGKNISATDISDKRLNEFSYPCYGGNGLRGYVKEATHNQNAVIIGRQGALCGNVKRVSGEFYPTEHAVVVGPKRDINIDWAFHILRAMNLNQYATKSAQPGLSVKRIEQLTIPVPPLPEQARIVAILDRFDALVNDITQGLPAEIAARRKQYEYYRDKLLTFKRKEPAQ